MAAARWAAAQAAAGDRQGWGLRTPLGAREAGTSLSCRVGIATRTAAPWALFVRGGGPSVRTRGGSESLVSWQGTSASARPPRTQRCQQHDWSANCRTEHGAERRAQAERLGACAHRCEHTLERGRGLQRERPYLPARTASAQNRRQTGRESDYEAQTTAAGRCARVGERGQEQIRRAHWQRSRFLIQPAGGYDVLLSSPGERSVARKPHAEGATDCANAIDAKTRRGGVHVFGQAHTNDSVQKVSGLRGTLGAAAAFSSLLPFRERSGKRAGKRREALRRVARGVMTRWQWTICHHPHKTAAPRAIAALRPLVPTQSGDRA